jgi:hypothetical protein
VEGRDVRGKRGVDYVICFLNFLNRNTNAEIWTIFRWPVVGQDPVSWGLNLLPVLQSPGVIIPFFPAYEA